MAVTVVDCTVLTRLMV